MQSKPRHNIAILGATGSIGQSTIDVVENLGPPYRVFAMTAHRSCEQLVDLAKRVHPRMLVMTGAVEDSLSSRQFATAEVRYGKEALEELARHPEVDTLVAAIVGSAGLLSCLAAAEAGKRLALANKEALVVAGPLLNQAVQQGGGQLLPIDSEHSAIFQALHAGRDRSEVRRLILTASGGSLRDWPTQDLARATAADALAHPTWQMGKKITVDSATMMNKALEVIEARWLFQVEPEKIQVVIHPQSMIHSMVEFVDGSIVAQLSPPDMRLPIQYALTYPERLPCPARSMDWSQIVSLDWQPIDWERYPALQLGFEAASRGGTCGAVLNAANEAAVGFFLEGRLRFTDIARVCREVVQQHAFDANPTLPQLLQLDAWARSEVEQWIRKAC
jgi:1-deoxy-D-xylulose-5-phosphate reductoisomerase